MILATYLYLRSVSANALRDDIILETNKGQWHRIVLKQVCTEITPFWSSKYKVDITGKSTKFIQTSRSMNFNSLTLCVCSYSFFLFATPHVFSKPISLQFKTYVRNIILTKLSIKLLRMRKCRAQWSYCKVAISVSNINTNLRNSIDIYIHSHTY